ncbi:DNA topoisomerase [Defluviimonas salinarum]|uniref:DNA topoisomerase n=1 Tax=Defluviimonas salinarum TaxID=2992147 RepID=A0ABT3J6F0_9RHOB|nr:DNA topoisomerase [Defluviimonas salinarum]MCW3782979.1 DNA topoisomerase [Defluviimonas salinarum]
MGSSLVICEKPSQAKAIRAAIGSRYGEVLPAVGHILTLKEPDDVREDWKEWSAELLWPGKFYEKKPVTNTKKYLDAIRAAARGAERIIIATDCDREGQLIGDEIVEFIGFRGQVQRCIFNAEDPKSLQDAFAKLRPNSEFRGLYMSGQAREQADQTSNLSLTRTATVTLKQPGTKGAIGIGRVKTPVLGIVCKRELEIETFKPQDMYEIDALTRVAAGQLTLTCGRLPKSLVKEEQTAEEEAEELMADEAALQEAESMVGRILKREIADGLRSAVEGYSGLLRSKAEKKRQGPPKLFDLTALQSAASARFGWGGEKTLSVAQKLYSERTLITYPRGEAKYLPENNIADIPTLVPALLRLGGYGQHAGLLAKPEARRGKSGHFSDKALEGMSHYAIIPNVNTASEFARAVPSLSDDEAKLFDMIARQYLAALAPDYEYRQTTIDMTFPWKGHDWDFRASGRVPLVPGWKAILGGLGLKDADEEPDLPEVKNGETGKVVSAALRTVTTKPPARYTEGSLIKVMQEAWRLVEDPAMRTRLKEAKGIGTPATRGDVVKGLLTQGQIVMKGKSLMPSEGGMKLYQTLVAVCPNVVDPARTAMWETIFDMVEKGKLSAEQAVLKILGETQKEIDRIKANAGAVSIAIGKSPKPTEKMAAAAKTICERKGIKLPPKCLTDASVCRSFLEEHLPKRDPNAPQGQGGTCPPSEKQIAFAERIARETGKEIPAEARASGRALSAWIDGVKPSSGPRPPSEKQLAFARKLAEENGARLPVAAETDGRQCSAFIDSMMAKGGARRKATA